MSVCVSFNTVFHFSCVWDGRGGVGFRTGEGFNLTVPGENPAWPQYTVVP